MNDWEIPNEINRLLDTIKDHNRLLETLNDGGALIDNQIAISSSISKLIETACLSKNIPLEKKVVLLFLSNILEGSLFYKTSIKLKDLSHSSDTFYGGYFESATFPRDGLNKDSSTIFLNPKNISPNWFSDSVNQSKSYTKKRIVSNLILMALVADSIERGRLGVSFDINKYHKYLRKIEFGGYYTMFLELVSTIPLVSNILLPISFQVDNSILRSNRFHKPRYLTATRYYEYTFLRDFPKDIVSIFYKIPDYISSKNGELFGDDVLFDVLNLHFNKALQLNQIEIDTFANWVYPPLLFLDKSNKKSPAYFTNNWEHLKNKQLKFLLND
jgi:hypothetical protein